MTDEARAARKAYFRRYYQTHKAQYKRNMDKYWQRKADEAKAAAAQAEASKEDVTDSAPAEGDNTNDKEEE